MSSSLVNIYASLPRTTRGAFTHLNADPKGQTLVYTNGNSVFMRNLAEPAQCDVYTEHSCAVQVAKYAPSGFYIASADQAGKVRIWDTVNKEHILKNEFQPLSGTIKDLQWSSDSQRLVVGGEGREKYGHVFSADTGTSVGEIMGTSKPINSVDFKPSRPFRCVVASEDNSICYFEGPPFKWKKALNEHDRFVNVVRYSPNGEKFASGGADGKLIVFDGKTGDKLDEIGSPAHSGGIYSLAWDPTSKMILTVSGDKSAKLWNVESKSLMREMKFGDSLDDQQVGCLWTGNHVLTVSLSGHINYINPLAGESADWVVRRLKGHNKSITALEVVNGTAIVSASHEGLICHWNAQSGQMDTVVDDRGVHQHKNQVVAMRYDEVNGLIVTCGYDDMLKFIDAKDFRYVAEIKLDSQPQGLDVNKNGTVLVACVNKLLVVKNKKIASSTNVSYETTSITVSSGSNAVAVGGRDSKCHVYALDDVNNATLVEILALSERDFITAVRFSPDGMYLAVADNAKCVKCYKVGTEYVDVTKDMWQHHAGKITAIAWAPDSQHLATSSVDTHCFVYSPSKISGSIQIKNAHPLNPLTSCAWLSNDHLVTASQDCCIRKWKINF